MKKNTTYIIMILMLAFAITSNNTLNAQCPYDNSIYLTGAAPTIVGTYVYAAQTWAGDFNRVTGMVAGYTYEVSTCTTPSFDSEITIYPSGGGTALGYDDDGCGTTSGPSKVLFTPTVTGDYDLLLDEYQCLSNNIDMEMQIKLISTGGSTGAAVTIPVVVHVVYKNATENVSNAQIQSQIDALNRDYRKLNTDFANVPAVFQPLGSDFSIDFCLASFDPNGNSTTGITHTSTTVASFDINTPPKYTSNGGHDNWDPQHYLNLWVCDLTGTLLGFATFPTDLATAPQLDGVVIDYQYFGTIGTSTPPFDLGRTATHEVGHWLNLRHIWGDANCGDDLVNDTPTQQTSNGGCPAFPHVTCSNGPNGDLFNNYMDYVDDNCMMLFTNGQKVRVDATFTNFRNAILNATGCGPTGIADINGNLITLTAYPNPSTGSVTIQTGNPTAKEVTVLVCNVLGETMAALKSSPASDGKFTLDFKGKPKGVYIIKLVADDNMISQKLIIQ
ncbi:MAG: M43 family zinc metalloprotease [Bacteroidia bacterium]